MQIEQTWSNEKRKASRLDVPLMAKYKNNVTGGTSRGALMKDLSIGGCLLLTPDKIKTGTSLEIELFMGKAESESIKLCGKVVRPNDKVGSNELGIAFDPMSRATRKLFTDYIFDKMYKLTGVKDGCDKDTKSNNARLKE